MSAAPTLLQRRKREAMLEIATTALDLFERDGFDATTVEAIAATAGCSPRTFYRYFGSKEDVVFLDLPEAINAMGEVLATRLAEGRPEWDAVTDTLVEFIARFDSSDEGAEVRVMQLWLREPALHARYLQRVVQAEQTVLGALCRHRRTRPENDDLAQLIALSSIGAYRATLLTHHGSRAGAELAAHLRRALHTLGQGLARA